MALILDTSAIIGLAERGNVNTAQLIARQTELPLLHVVSLGELHAGITRAVAARLDQAVIDARRRTLTIAIECEITHTMEPDVFGAIAAEASRRVSHNDMWIAAAALHHEAILVTEDHILADHLDKCTLPTLPGRRIETHYVGT